MGIKASIRSQVRKTSFKKMKIAALVSVVAAGRQARDAQSLFNKMLGDHNNNVEQRNFVFSETDSLYQIFQFYMGNKGQDFSKVDDMLSYGCWCQIRNQEAEGIVPGHGTPVDELDAACKRWHQCRACTTVDFSTDGTCVPNDVAYEVGFDPVTMRIDCQFNPDECSTMNCGCDEQVAFSMKNFSPSLMVPVLITPVNAMPQLQTPTMVMETVPMVTVLKIQPTQVVTEEMVTAVMVVTTMVVKMVQLSKNSNVVELIQTDSNF